MFKKIVSNLPFSPALVGQLGYYSKKLRKDKITRRLGLIFVILTIIIQSFAVFQPPESANASNSNVNSIGALVLADNQSLAGDVIKSLTATNASQGFVDASSVKAYVGDQISYTITIENTGSTPATTQLKESLIDVLDYSTLIDNGGGVLDTNKILTWPDVTLAPNTKQTRTFTIRLLDTTPATAQGVNNPKSYDCVMTNAFGNLINVSVDCPVLKTVEGVITDLPKAGVVENVAFAGILLLIIAYFYARSRQLEKEIRLIRKDEIAGTIL